MELLENRILTEGEVLDGGVLKVGSFLNQQVDSKLLAEMADEVARRFSGKKIDKVLTIEASGIPFATAVALRVGVNMVYAKKHKSKNVSGEVYKAEVASYTHGNVSDVVVAKDYIKRGEKVLICDDFLAVGNALGGLLEIVRQAGAEAVGCAIEIEKGFQKGGDKLREEGVDVFSLAIVDDMSDGKITFRKQ